MAGRQLKVEIIGDASSLQTALKQANTSVNQLGRTIDTKLGRSSVSVAGQFGPLLDSTRKMQTQADELSTRLGGVGAAAASEAAPGIGAMIARMGVATFAISSIYQGSQHLQQALKATGAEAFTTSGRLRNFAASLSSGDIVGGLQALGAQPKTLQEAGISAQEATIHYDAFKAAAGRLKGSMGDLVRQAVALADAQRASENAANSLADATSRLGTAFVTSTGQAVLFKGAVDDLARPRGPGGVNQINAMLRATRITGTGRAFTPVGPEAKNQISQAIAAASGDLPALLQAQIAERDRLQKAVSNAIHKTVQVRTKLNVDLGQARAAVIQTQKQIQANAAADAAAAAAAAKARAAEAAALRKQQLEEAKNRRLALLAAAQRRQFRAIGLGPTGAERVPTISNLQKQFAALSKNVVGQDVPRNLRDRLRLVGKFLQSDLKGVTEETRRAIKELFDTIRGTFDTEAKKGPLTKTTTLNVQRILQGVTGLDRDQLRHIRANLSGFNSAGVALAGSAQAVNVTTNTTIRLDGDVVARAVTRHQQKTARRNPKQKRGPNR